MADAISLATQVGFPNQVVLQDLFYDWVPDTDLWIGNNDLPLEDYPSELIRWDKRHNVTGVTNMSGAQGAPIQVRSRGAESNYAPVLHFADEVSYEASDFQRMRELGQLSKLAGEEQIMSDMQMLEIRLQARLELSRWQVLSSGYLNVVDKISGAVSVNYGFPASHFPVAGSTSGYGVVWTDHDNSTPVDDLQKATELFFGVSDMPPSVYMNGFDVRHYATNLQFRDLVKQNPLLLNLGREGVPKIYPTLIGNIKDMTVYTPGYLDETAVDGDGNPTYNPFIPLGYVVLIAPPQRGQKLGALRTSPDIRNGGITNPRAGKWMVIEDSTTKIVPTYRMACGINFLPVIFFPRNIVVLRIY